MNRATALPALFSLALLAGCSGGPNEEQITSVFGLKVRDVACKEAADKPGYNCTWIFVDSGRSDSSRFIEADGGWRIAGP